MTIGEKSSEYAEKCFPSDDISNSGKHNVARPFSVEEYIKNPERKVVTRDGRDVRIICIDRKGTEDTVLALCLMSDGSENCYCYPPNGKVYLSADSCMDLFFAPEKKEGWLNLYKDENGRVVIGYYEHELRKNSDYGNWQKTMLRPAKSNGRNNHDTI